MGFGALVAAIQGPVTAPPRSLWIDGADVLQGQGTLGTRFGVPRDSIEVIENGPPGVSSLRFTINDPSKAITLRRGQTVIYHNHVTDRPHFRGFLQGWSTRPVGLGRTFTVRCIGIEALLDWMVVPSLTIPAGTQKSTGVQSIIANATGLGIPLRAFIALGFPKGNQAGPVGHNTDALDVDLVLTGVTVRRALEMLSDAPTGGAVTPDTRQAATVDFYLGLRFWLLSDPTQFPYSGPEDYATLTVTDTIAGALAAENLNHDVDASVPVAGVFVQGGNAAGTGLVAAGDGLPGAIPIISDSSILTAAARDAKAQAYIAARVTQERGSFDLLDTSVPANVRAGSALVLTDAETGATGTYQISSIGRRFTGLRETWHVTYGRLAPSLPRAIRYRTRDVTS